MNPKFPVAPILVLMVAVVKLGVFEVIMVFKSRYDMIGRFIIMHLCGEFPYEKMAAWFNGEMRSLFPFWVVQSMCMRFVTTTDMC